ncbi:hypothetical protein [Pseudonocardia acaciae]|uniref:hypothetical protein n=1 Tax=Pseudonocardia acaciae TaxID=551276 RepID=UPI0007E8E6DC|nr:hypothetical protein [Pseudonocardia acaciae]
MGDVGILMLDNNIPRPLGDVGNAQTFDFPVAYRVVPGADTALVVERAADGLLGGARAVARQLVDAGARAITTCCGFLAIVQRELADDTAVPVATSSLLQVPLVLQTLRRDQRLCVLTVNAATLTEAHFHAVGVTAAHLDRVVVAGLEHTDHFFPAIMEKIDHLDPARAEAEVVAAARGVVESDTAIGAFVFECTNLPPYAGAVRAATGRPVWDATSLIGWLHAGVSA